MKTTTGRRDVVRFVVNADDLGLNSEINHAILSAFEDGVITSATIMANGPAFAEAVAGVKRFPNASVGVHLNLTACAPMTRAAALGPLLGPDGAFAEDAVYTVRWTPPLLAAVAEEWTAQVQSVRRAGVDVTHLDSHHHVHTLPALFYALKAVQWRHGIRRVRGTWSIYDRSSAPSPLLVWKKRLWLAAVRCVLPTRTADEFSDFLMFLRAHEEGSYRPRSWPRVVELMVHPSSDAVSAVEAATLRGGWTERLSCHAALASYANL